MAYPGSPIQQQCQWSSHINAGTASALELSVQALMLAVMMKMIKTMIVAKMLMELELELSHQTI